MRSKLMYVTGMLAPRAGRAASRSAVARRARDGAGRRVRSTYLARSAQNRTQVGGQSQAPGSPTVTSAPHAREKGVVRWWEVSARTVPVPLELIASRAGRQRTGGASHGGRARKRADPGCHACHVERCGSRSGWLSIGVKLLREGGEDIGFHQVHGPMAGASSTAHLLGRRRGSRLQRHRKGYDLGARRWVSSPTDRLSELPLTSSRAIEVLELVPAEQVDPIILRRPTTWSRGTPHEPYVLARDAIVESDRWPS